MTPEQKTQAHQILCRRFGEEMTQRACYAIDDRLGQYFDDICKTPDMHNGYEILCAVKFLRLLRTYEFNERKVRQIIYLREGEWQRDPSGRWRHISGGIKCPGTDTAHVYRWQPFQIFVLASVFGFHTWFNTEVKAIDKAELLPTEREREDGYVEDFRRLCNYFVMYTPRKTDKTGMSAYIQLVFFLLQDYNSEIYCCANAEFQSKILYNRVQFLLKDVDTMHRFRLTAKITDWKPKYRDIRNASIMPLTAGGKAKDGPFAELVNWDELGSSPYVNGKSDMMGLVNVMRSSMGPRREGLTFGTTTAGTITQGPFIDMLDKLHTGLLREIDYENGTDTPTLSEDRSLCLLLEPDDWEKEKIEDLLTDKSLRRKINPMLGITCQHQFYDDSYTDMLDGKMTKDELISKLYNVYQSGRVTSWMKADRIYPLQTDKRIADCRYEDGWGVFVGLDFSHGDDLFAISYLGVNYKTAEPRGRFFADCEAWILESTLKESPNRALYEIWIEQGWLYVCPGEVFDPMYAITMLAQKNEQGVNLVMFGYDPAQSIQPINNLKAWLLALGIDSASIQNMVVPVGQSSMVQNPRVIELEDMIKSNVQALLFSQSPLWPWCIGNVAVESNTSNLRRLIKSTPNAKIDPVAALEDALYLFDLSEGRVQ